MAAQGIGALESRIQDLNGKLKAAFARYGDGEMPEHVSQDVGRMTDELREATVRLKIARESFVPQPALVHPGGRPAGGSGEGIGGLIVGSGAFKTLDRTPGGAAQSVEIPYHETKAVLTLTGFAPQSRREELILPYVTQPLRVADLFPETSTDQSSVKYMEETTFTNTAAETAEGEAKPEATLVFTERTEEVRKIAVTLPVTDEALDDNAGLEAYLNQRLPHMINLREDSQLLVGDGTAPNLSGILDRAGLQTQAKGADSTPAAIYKAAVKVFVSQYLRPDAVVIHPNDWQDVRLLTTADGIFIFGEPATAGAETIFGMRVVITPAITEGTALVGAFSTAASIRRRQALTVTMSTEHDDFYAKNKCLFRAETRLALVVLRPAAFCSVTGL